ncbi:MAG: hypothetical protein LW878_14035, partial [Proteobacteria bacterium]|nr:hypothetical protein [Pseudomonadota bacterium]
PLKVCANSSRGQDLEARESCEFHQTELPLLVCPQLLRARGMGQVDLARWERRNKIVRVREVKSRPEFYGEKQRRRLKESVRFLSLLFKSAGLLESSSVCKDR